jgi:hypothetical protein
MKLHFLERKAGMRRTTIMLLVKALQTARRVRRANIGLVNTQTF